MSQSNQPELFPTLLLDHCQKQAHPRKGGQLSKHDFSLSLSRALTSENISATTWAIMAAIDRAEGSRSIVLLTTDTGMSYWAIRNQANRTQWFTFSYTGTLVHLTLSEDGKAKLERVIRKL